MKQTLKRNEEKKILFEKIQMKILKAKFKKKKKKINITKKNR